MNEKYVKWCLQEDFRERFETRLGNETWLTVYKRSPWIWKDGTEDPFVWGFLIDLENVEEELGEYTFEQFNGYPVTDNFTSGNQKLFYSRYGRDDREPIAFQRDFPTKPGYIEISQEFVHFFGLFHDIQKNQFILESPDGKEEIVAKIIDDNEIQIKTHRIKQFLAFKNMALVICVVHRHHFNQPIGGDYVPSRNNRVLQYTDAGIHYALWYQDGMGDAMYLTEVIGKKVIYGMAIENTGIYPFEKESEFENFVIEVDEEGNLVEYSCNPKQLSNYFGANPDAPHYLTPVYFSKDVLAKYYGDPSKYQVQDGNIMIGSYILRADTNHQEYVVVFLGDLGRDIPFSEQKYWKSFNIMPEAGMSKTALERAFLGRFSDPEAEQFIFRQKYKVFQDAWKKKFGWDLIKPLNEGDQYRLEALRIPVAENQQEFDQLVGHLAVLLVESINDKQIQKNLSEAESDEKLVDIKSIKKLELLCGYKSYKEFEPHIELLKDLHWLRSSGSAHRKGTKEYQKIRKVFQIDEKGYIEVFRELLQQAIQFLDYFTTIALSDE